MLPDFQEGFFADMNLFEFSDYPQTHFLFSTANKKVLGKFKDELNGELAFEFVCSKAKIFSLKSGKEEKNWAKGVSTHIVRRK